MKREDDEIEGRGALVGNANDCQSVQSSEGGNSLVWGCVSPFRGLNRLTIVSLQAFSSFNAFTRSSAQASALAIMVQAYSSVPLVEHEVEQHHTYTIQFRCLFLTNPIPKP